MTILHAGLIARRVDGDWRGVLIEGPSGAGKTDLALRALALGWRLVADDRTMVWRSREGLYGRSPPALTDLIEVREAGVAQASALRFVRIRLRVRHQEAVERALDPVFECVQDVQLRCIGLNLRAASAVERLRAALAMAAFQ